jgi:hypothetical protein
MNKDIIKQRKKNHFTALTGKNGAINYLIELYRISSDLLGTELNEKELKKEFNKKLPLGPYVIDKFGIKYMGNEK